MDLTYHKNNIFQWIDNIVEQNSTIHTEFKAKHNQSTQSLSFIITVEGLVTVRQMFRLELAFLPTYQILPKKVGWADVGVWWWKDISCKVKLPFAKSIVILSIPMVFNWCFSYFGIAPKMPIMISTIFALLLLLYSCYYSYHCILQDLQLRSGNGPWRK